jgi:cysteine-rich repeat protein
MRLVLAVWFALVAACVKPESVACSFGTCPTDTICDDVHAICATREQLEQCDGQADLLRCTAAEGGGRCDRGVCIPACGDGILNANEECDDGDLESHDGCSSLCTDEVPTWKLWESGWVGRSSHTAAYDANRGRLVIFGGLAADGTRRDVWERDAAGEWHRGAPGPTLYDSAMAFDAARGVIVLFGGRDLNASLPSRETWTYDGTSWQLGSPAASPPARHSHMMVYDAANQRTVLFGGRPDNTNTWIGDTWSYDGTTWTPVTSTLNPLERSSSGIAYDELRQRIVLFGGLAGYGRGDTWELVGNQWSPVGGAGPAPRFGPGMAYSPARQAVVLFGGHYHPNDMPLSDTWEYTASGWKLISLGINPPGRRRTTLTRAGNDVALVGGFGVTGSTEAFDDVWNYTCTTPCTTTSASGAWSLAPVTLSPSPRSKAALVHDETRDELIVVGGLSNEASNGARTDTWRFMQGVWQVARNQEPPPRRRDHASAYDRKRDRVVVFGGSAGNDALIPTVLYADTWEWNGQDWTQGPNGPPARSGAAMAYDDEDDVIVMFGGRDMSTATMADTWELADGSWREVASATSPPCCGKMVYDPNAKRIIYVQDGQTWAYDDHAWTQLDAAGTPARTGFGLAYEQRRGAVMLFGGRAANGAVHADLWQLVDGTWSEVPVPVGPGGRYDASLAAQRTGNGLVLYGGYTGAQYAADTWLFSYDSSVPDEVCTGDVDDDGDTAIDCMDDDCAFACP